MCGTVLAGAVSVLLTAAQGPAAAAPDKPAAIRVTNFTDGQTLRFTVPLICGKLADEKLTSVTIVNTSSKRPTRKLTGLAHKGRFKVLTELLAGPNRLVIRAGKSELGMTLHYKPQTNPYIVRVIYFVDKSGDTRFQTPLAKDPQNWRGKLDTAMKLMQGFTAQRLGDVGLGLRTFNLELGRDGKVKVHVLKGRHPAAHYHKLNGHQLYGEAGRELRRQLPHRRARNLVIPAFTRFDPATRRAMAHTALGGGHVALFGGGDLFTWPDSLAGVQPAFMNAERVDHTKFFSDSVGRHTFWANASTTMGAALHELGHTFGLPHSRDVHDIMTRGHDRLNRFYTLVEPPHARRNRPTEFAGNQIACWSPVSAGALAPNRYFALDNRTWRDAKKATVRFDRPSKCVIIASDYGIRYVGLWRTGRTGGRQAVFPAVISRGGKLPAKISVPLAELKKHMGDTNIEFRVIDNEGIGTLVSLAPMLKGPYVTAWRFASISSPWRAPRSIHAINAKRLAEIEASAAKAKLVQTPGPFVDFKAVSGIKAASDVTAYAMRTIRTDKVRKIKIHTGSDDTLQMWVNGKLIRRVATLRSAVPDSEVTTAELRKGDNRLLVEVCQAGGDWGLVLRITDADGADLELKDDGKLVPAKPLFEKAKK